MTEMNRLQHNLGLIEDLFFFRNMGSVELGVPVNGHLSAYISSMLIIDSSAHLFDNLNPFYF